MWPYFVGHFQCDDKLAGSQTGLQNPHKHSLWVKSCVCLCSVLVMLDLQSEKFNPFIPSSLYFNCELSMTLIRPTGAKRAIVYDRKHNDTPISDPFQMAHNERPHFGYVLVS